MPEQDALFQVGAAARDEHKGRERALAGFIAGWRWPGAGSFDRLPKTKQDAATQAARTVLQFLEAAE